jgi:hypothetical protein
MRMMIHSILGDWPYNHDYVGGWKFLEEKPALNLITYSDKESGEFCGA